MCSHTFRTNRLFRCCYPILICDIVTVIIAFVAKFFNDSVTVLFNSLLKKHKMKENECEWVSLRERQREREKETSYLSYTGSLLSLKCVFDHSAARYNPQTTKLKKIEEESRRDREAERTASTRWNATIKFNAFLRLSLNNISNSVLASQQSRRNNSTWLSAFHFSR